MYGKKYTEVNNIISKEIVNQYPEFVKKGNCYSNIYDLVCKTMDILVLVKQEKMKICVGYIDSGQGYLARHMFIVDKFDIVIDPTLALIDELEVVYYPIKEYTVEEYMEALEKEGFTALYNDTMTENLEFQKLSFLTNNKPCIG